MSYRTQIHPSTEIIMLRVGSMTRISASQPPPPPCAGLMVWDTDTKHRDIPQGPGLPKSSLVGILLPPLGREQPEVFSAWSGWKDREFFFKLFEWINNCPEFLFSIWDFPFVTKWTMAIISWCFAHYFLRSWVMLITSLSSHRATSVPWLWLKNK